MKLFKKLKNSITDSLFYMKEQHHYNKENLKYYTDQIDNFCFGYKNITFDWTIPHKNKEEFSIGISYIPYRIFYKRIKKLKKNNKNNKMIWFPNYIELDLDSFEMVGYIGKVPFIYKFIYIIKILLVDFNLRKEL